MRGPPDRKPRGALRRRRSPENDGGGSSPQARLEACDLPCRSPRRRVSASLYSYSFSGRGRARHVGKRADENMSKYIIAVNVIFGLGRLSTTGKRATIIKECNRHVREIRNSVAAT